MFCDESLLEDVSRYVDGLLSGDGSRYVDGLPCCMEPFWSGLDAGLPEFDDALAIGFDVDVVLFILFFLIESTHHCVLKNRLKLTDADQKSQHN